MKDFLGNELVKEDRVVFIQGSELKEGVVVGGGKQKVTILSTRRDIDESIGLKQNEEGKKWYSTWKDFPQKYSISFSKVYKK
jgi:glutaredoxin-related protein